MARDGFELYCNMQLGNLLHCTAQKEIFEGLKFVSRWIWSNYHVEII